MKVTPIAKMGCFGVTTAFLYDKNNKPIGNCIDTPNGIAKAMMENSNIEKVIGYFPDKVSYRKDYIDRMNNYNTAKSYLNIID